MEMRALQQPTEEGITLRPDLSLQALRDQIQEAAVTFEQLVEIATELKNQLDEVENKIFNVMKKESLLQAIVRLA